ncbi:MAG: translation initiation factor IF-2 [Bdellovibrio sp.]|nr:translation initiation factor IF-2 [Bdellovibrio sp.]
MVKVYELAKELGIDSISLLDKLKKLNINVKNHMSDLKAEEVQIARSSLRKPSETEKVGKKAPTKARKKGTTAAEASASAASQGSTADAEKRTASPVLRRRVKTEGGVETTVTQSSVISHRQAAEHTHEEVADHREAPAVYQEEEQQTFVEEQSPVESLDTATSESSDLMETDMGAAGSSQLLEDHQVAVSDQVTPESTSVAEGESAPAVSAEPETPTTTTAQPITPPVKTRPPVVLTPRPVAPRRSILKIVEATAPPPRPIIKPAPAPATTQPKVVKGTTTTQDKDGFRIIKMTKENLDQMVEEEAAKKRGAGREVELRPEDIRFADYRKKELVFLPKKKRIPLGKEIKKTQKTVSKAQKRIVQMQETISVQDLANQLSVKAADVIRKTMALGQMVSIQQHLDFDTATLIAHEYQYEVRNVAFNESSFLANNQEDPEGSLVHRPPVVTIMGHVDHGKTTLLDSIREANVAGGEAGGITQHIGAYTVNKNGKLITFIDTPGHEAFTVMRARGANVTDIVILVVSADDGVMPQTREALSHAQAAKVPVIVAVNKIDKPGANPEKIKQGLAELNLLAEDWGGDTIFVPVSALKKTNLDKLLDAVLLQAEMLDLKANPDVLASGVVLEARVEKGRGAVVSVLVSKGTLKIGDPLVSGNFTGKVKAMVNDKGQTQKITTPGIAVEILGFEGLPNAGDSFNVTADEGTARKIVENRVDKTRAKAMATGNTKVSLEELFSKIQTGTVKELNVILKADAFGSAEAIRDSLVKLSTEKVKVKPILCSPGGITESDVLLGSASSAIILGFNVRPETKARQIAEAEHVEIKCYSIIYELLDDVKKAMTGLLDKKKVERFLGRAEVRQTFVVPKIGTIAGAAVIDGKILRGANVRLLRDSRIIYEGKMSSLRRFKDDAKEVAQGFECGIGIENYNDLKAGDIIEAYQIDLVTPELS